MGRALKTPRPDIEKIEALIRTKLKNNEIRERTGTSITIIAGVRKRLKRVEYELSNYVQIHMAAKKIERSPQIVQNQYCDISRRCVVTELAGPQDRPYRGVPTGWSE